MDDDGRPSDLESTKGVDLDHSDKGNEVVPRPSCIFLCCFCFFLQTLITVVISVLCTPPTMELTSLKLVSMELNSCRSKPLSFNASIDIALTLSNQNIVDGVLDKATISIRSIDRSQDESLSASVLLVSTSLIEPDTVLSPGLTPLQRRISIYATEPNDIRILQRLVRDCKTSQTTLLQVAIRNLRLRLGGALSNAKPFEYEISSSCPNTTTASHCAD